MHVMIQTHFGPLVPLLSTRCVVRPRLVVLRVIGLRKRRGATRNGAPGKRSSRSKLLFPRRPSPLLSKAHIQIWHRHWNSFPLPLFSIRKNECIFCDAKADHRHCHRTHDENPNEGLTDFLNLESQNLCDLFGPVRYR